MLWTQIIVREVHQMRGEGGIWLIKLNVKCKFKQNETNVLQEKIQANLGTVKESVIMHLYVV